MSHHDREIVPALERALAQRIGTARFETWFVGNARFGLANGVLEIRVANRFYEDWLRRNFREEIDASTADILGRAVAVEYRIDAPPKPAKEVPASTPVQSFSCETSSASSRRTRTPFSRAPRVVPSTDRSTVPSTVREENGEASTGDRPALRPASIAAG